MHISLTNFLKEVPSEIRYNADGAICERFFGLNRHHNHEKEVAEKAINKDDNQKRKQDKLGRRSSGLSAM